jgi:hypothetical protein
MDSRVFLLRGFDVVGCSHTNSIELRLKVITGHDERKKMVHNRPKLIETIMTDFSSLLPLEVSVLF